MLEGYTNFPRESFDKHLETFYPLAVGLLEKEIGSSELRGALWGIFRRAGEVRFGMVEFIGQRAREGSLSAMSERATPTSPGHRFEWSRRGSRVSNGNQGR